MRRPWQIWLLFFLGLAVAVPAMGWLTVKALELDEAEVEARRRAEGALHEAEFARGEAETARAQAELEERASSALWRLDTALAPLLAQEAARPAFVYRPFYSVAANTPNANSERPTGGKGDSNQSMLVPSPIIVQPSEYVRLNFQLSPDGRLESPQVPQGPWRQSAFENGVPDGNIRLSENLLADLRIDLVYDDLIAALPTEVLPPLPFGDLPYGERSIWNSFASPLGNSSYGVNNEFGFRQFEQGGLSNRQSPNGAGQGQAPGPGQAEGQQRAPPQSVDPSPVEPFESRPKSPVAPHTSPTETSPSEPSGGSGGTPANSARPLADPASRQPTLPPPTDPLDRRQQGGLREQPVVVQNDGQFGLNANPYATPRGGSQDMPPRGQETNASAVDRDGNARDPRQAAANPRATEHAEMRDQQSQSPQRDAEWLLRNRAFQSYAQQAVVQQRLQPQPEAKPPLTLVREGVSRPLWAGSKLLLLRRVDFGGDVYIQGCWFNWPMLKERLLDDIADLLPDADLEPVTDFADANPRRMLATLPVKLATADAAPPHKDLVERSPDSANPAPPLSPIRVSLIIAWAGLALAAVAVAGVLSGVVALSERRAAFVAAVTHELRTPLTTFRMYAEMLADNMLPSAEQRLRYVETLRVEADRLTHLVENVLAYAQLERGRRGGRRENVTLGQLVARVEERLADRARQAGMELIAEGSDEARNEALRTDPAAVEQILFNLVDNACKYAAPSEDRRVHMEWEADAVSVRLRVRDHGPGVSPDAAARLFTPFSKSVQQAANSAPGVGLGLSLCRRLARELGGKLELEHNGESGACFVLELPR